MKSKVLIFPKPQKVGFSHINIPEPRAGQILTKTIMTGISTGTETRVWRGGEDANAFPLIPGYENVGEIIRVGDGVALTPGTRVFHSGSDFTGDFSRLWGAHSEISLIQADNAIVIPEDVKTEDAVYTLVGAIALHGIHRGKVAHTDKVAVVGLGLIGHLAAQCATSKGAHVIAVDFDDARVDAIEPYADVCLNATGIYAEARVKELTDGGVDVVVDVTGVPHAADSIARLITPQPWAPPYPPNGRVVLLGSYSEPVSFHYHPTLFANEPDILPSRYCTKDEMVEIVAMMADGRLKPNAIPAQIYAIEDAISAYDELVDKKMMRVLFEW